jgi:hypothetical protein
MIEIQLTQGKVSIIDEADFELVNKFKWHARRQKDCFYAEARYKNTTISMHRYILGLKDKGTVVDHKDGDGLNNQRSNLRPCTHGQNMANRRASKNKSSQFLGVTWNKRKSRWRVFIQKDNKPLFLGQFKDEHEAALAYNHKAVELHGEFANLNKLDPSLEIKRNGQLYISNKAEINAI